MMKSSKVKIAALALLVAIACTTSAAEPAQEPASPVTPLACSGAPLRVSFYDAGQGLAVLVALPDGKHILVDTGESPTRPGCGAPCKDWHHRVMAELAHDLGDAPIDLLWITHPHSDHLGGAVDVVRRFAVVAYVDNGLELTKAAVQRTHEALAAQNVPMTVVDPAHTAIPLADTGEVRLTAIVPPRWSPACQTNENLCSILLRIDYCASSVLFTGDAEGLEEADLSIGGQVTLLQVGHHGSNTSSTPALLDQAAPTYAVISAGHPDEGTNRTYCHPRAETVHELTTRLGGTGSGTVRAFPSSTSCRHPTADTTWVDEPASDRLWASARDGTVVLVTSGDGRFQRE